MKLEGFEELLDEKYSSYLNGVDFFMDKFDSIVINEFEECSIKAERDSLTARLNKKLDGIGGVTYCFGKMEAYHDVTKILRRFVEEMMKTRETGYGYKA